MTHLPNTTRHLVNLFSDAKYGVPPLNGTVPETGRKGLTRYKTSQGNWIRHLSAVVFVQSLNHVWPFVTPWTTARQASLSITNSQSLPNSCPSSQWCYPTISSSVDPFSSCLKSFPVSRSFPMSQLFASGGQSIGVSASVSVLPMNIQNCFPLGLTGWISLQSKWPSRVFSNTTAQKRQFFSSQFPLWSNSHIHTWPWKNHSFD